jgi:hypothetical protein
MRCKAKDKNGGILVDARRRDLVVHKRVEDTKHSIFLRSRIPHGFLTDSTTFPYTTLLL